MKKLSKVLSVLFASIFVVCVASCEHKHNIGGEEWFRDSSSHWHACDGCDELFDLSVHSYGDYVKDSKECKQTRTCTVCGFVYIGETPPELCPVCKVPPYKFEKIEGRA
jgi:rubredoxin